MMTFFFLLTLFFYNDRNKLFKWLVFLIEKIRSLYFSKNNGVIENLGFDSGVDPLEFVSSLAWSEHSFAWFGWFTMHVFLESRVHVKNLIYSSQKRFWLLHNIRAIDEKKGTPHVNTCINK